MAKPSKRELELAQSVSELTQVVALLAQGLLQALEYLPAPIEERRRMLVTLQKETLVKLGDASASLKSYFETAYSEDAGETPPTPAND